jgi:hypothetical protein
MPHTKVALYIRITTPDGKRKMCKPVYASRGRLKPLYAADAKGNSLGHHPEGEYYLRYAGCTEAVGNDPYVALDRLEERKAELRGAARADSPTNQPQTVERKSARVATLDAAITEYLTTGKAAEKKWRKHTLQCYTLGLKLFRESCSKTYLNEIDGATCGGSRSSYESSRHRPRRLKRESVIARYGTTSTMSSYF